MRVSGVQKTAKTDLCYCPPQRRAGVWKEFLTCRLRMPTAYKLACVTPEITYIPLGFGECHDGGVTRLPLRNSTSDDVERPRGSTMSEERTYLEDIFRNVVKNVSFLLYREVRTGKWVWGRRTNGPSSHVLSSESLPVTELK